MLRKANRHNFGIALVQVSGQGRFTKVPPSNRQSKG